MKRAIKTTLAKYVPTLSITEFDKSKLDEWDIDMFNFTPADELAILESIFDDLSFYDTYKIKKKEFSSFIGELRQAYSKYPNPFHNF